MNMIIENMSHSYYLTKIWDTMFPWNLAINMIPTLIGTNHLITISLVFLIESITFFGQNGILQFIPGLIAYLSGDYYTFDYYMFSFLTKWNIPCLLTYLIRGGNTNRY